MLTVEKKRIPVSVMAAIFIVGYGVLLLTGVSSIRHLIDNIVATYLLGWALYGILSTVTRAELGKRFTLTTASLSLCWLLAEGAALLGAVWAQI